MVSQLTNQIVSMDDGADQIPLLRLTGEGITTGHPTCTSRPRNVFGEFLERVDGGSHRSRDSLTLLSLSPVLFWQFQEEHVQPIYLHKVLRFLMP